MPNPNTPDALTATMMRHLHTLADDIGPRTAGLREVVALVAEIVCAIANRTPEWSRPQPEA